MFYSDENATSNKKNVVLPYKYDRWVEYDGKECYFTLGVWVCIAEV
jgi:hypothetical protein